MLQLAFGVHLSAVFSSNNQALTGDSPMVAGNHLPLSGQNADSTVNVHVHTLIKSFLPSCGKFYQVSLNHLLPFLSQFFLLACHFCYNKQRGRPGNKAKF